VRTVVVVNPNATTMRRRTGDVLLAALSARADVTIATTTHRDHAIELGAGATRDGVEVVIAYGGDGTVNEVINGLLVDGPGPQVPHLGVIPGGSANVFARNLGLPNDPLEATARLLRALAVPGRRRTIGLGQADSRWFGFNAGLGLDAETVHAVERARHRGKRATPGLYLRSAVRSYVTTQRRHPPLRGVLPGGEQLPEMFLALVTNSSPWTYLGPIGVRATPRSSFDAGLDLVATGSLSPPTLLRHVVQILGTRHGPRGADVVHRHDLTWLRLTSTRPVALQVDGDYLGTVADLSFRAVPDALRVLV
jgi:diacylglycerol kinase family enzyme